MAAASVLACLFSTITGLAAMRRALPPRAAPQPCACGEMLRMARVNGHLFLRTVCLLAQTNIFMITTASFGTLTISANAVILQIMLIFSYVFEGIANTSSVFAGKAAGQGCAVMLEKDAAPYPALVPGAPAGHDPGLCPGARVPAAPVHRPAGSPGSRGTVRGLGAYASPACAALGLTYYGLFTGSSLTRPVFLSTLQALAAFGLAWLAFVPFWGNHGLWGAYLIFLRRQVVLPAALLAPAAQRAFFQA